MTIYCSRKLEAFLGKIEKATPSTPSQIFGDWNGHIFILNRQKCLILTSNRTGYSLITTKLLKKDVSDFSNFFKERLITQLDYDFKLNEKQEVGLRTELAKIVISNSNGDKRIITTMNHLTMDLRYNDFGRNWDDFRVTAILNERPLGAKLPITNRKFKDFFVPMDVVRELIK